MPEQLPAPGLPAISDEMKASLFAMRPRIHGKRTRLTARKRTRPRPLERPSEKGSVTPHPFLRFVAAPMVGASDLAFRLMARKYGATLACTPMLYSHRFVSDDIYRRTFQTCPQDRPLSVQFCGNEPEVMLAAAKLVEDQVDAVDINLGCPQREAYNLHYGCYLLDETQHATVLAMVRTLSKNLKVMLPILYLYH
jgi:hypothetical protein